jgi:precorrin-3B synthase
MQTGDGLLARLIVHEPISLTTLSELCTAAENYGNGIIEVTQRGSLQIRGLTERSAPDFARVVNQLGIARDGNPPLITTPLAGLDVHEQIDPTALISALVATFRSFEGELSTLGPKVSVLVDGGGRLHLDAISADVRLVALSDSLLQLSLGGTAVDATPVARVTVEEAPQAVMALLRQITALGPTARGRTFVATATRSVPSSRPPADPVGLHTLKDGTFALGFALAFGHTKSVVLRQAVATAANCGVTGIRPAPGRALLAIGLRHIDELREWLTGVGFVVETADPRRQVIACVGSPACASGQLPTRQLAPEVARAIPNWAGTGKVIHLAGCSKGCAHPEPATVTLVGPNRVVLNGRAGDAPHKILSSADLMADLEKLCNDI